MPQKYTFAPRLYEHELEIQAQFRSHQRTILQLATRYKVGQETMRQFLILTLGEEYPMIVHELRDMLRLRQRQSLFHDGLAIPDEALGEPKLKRSMADFPAYELEQLRKRVEELKSTPRVSYHPYCVSPLEGDL